MDAIDDVRSALADRYRIESELGRGSSASVYLADDLRYQRRVAVKVLNREVAAAVGAERFLREIELAAKLNHPHILPLLDSGEANGLLYYVMPAVEGEPLRAKMQREQQLPMDDVVQIARDVGVALDHAHRQGVVHRDVKPENILLSAGTAVVADFGIAKLLTTGPSVSSSVSRAGFAIGTVLYMSPEQASGDEVDARSDQYSLACVVYEMLAGEPPYVGKSLGSVIAKHLGDPIPSVRRLRATVAPTVDGVLARALAKAPADRYASVAVFVDALSRARQEGSHERVRMEVREALTGGPGGAPAQQRATPAAAAGVASPPPAQTPRRRVLLVVAILAALGVAAAVIWRATASRASAEPATTSAAAGPLQSIAVLPFDDLSPKKDQAYLSTGVADEILAALARLPGLKVAARTSSLAARRDTLEPREIGQRLGVASFLEGSVQRVRDSLRIRATLASTADGSTLLSVGVDGSVDDLFRLQDSIAQAIVAKLQLQLGGRRTLVAPPTRDTAAYRLFLQGRYAWTERSETSLHDAVRLFRQALTHDPSYARAWAGLADTYNVIALNFYGPPRQYYPLALTAAQRALRLDSTLAEAHGAYASYLHFYARDWAKARREYQRALQLDPSASTVRYFYSIFLSALQDDSALYHARKAAEDDPLSPPVAQGLGMAYYLSGKYTEAASALREAIDLTPKYYFPHAWMGLALARTGRGAEGIAEAKLAESLAPGNTLVRAMLSQTYAVAGQRDSALAIARELEAEANRGLAVPLTYLARAYAALGDADKTITLLNRAIDAGEGQLAQTRGAPEFAAIAQDPRFQQILRKLQLQ